MNCEDCAHEKVCEGYSNCEEVGLCEPKRPHGEWINPSENPEFSNREFFYDCSICGNTQMDETNFCPNCGSDNRKKVKISDM